MTDAARLACDEIEWLATELCGKDAADSILAALRTIREELERDSVDAERYRWLRRGEPKEIPPPTASFAPGREPYVLMELPGQHPVQLKLYGLLLDTAIDAARGSP